MNNHTVSLIFSVADRASAAMGRIRTNMLRHTEAMERRFGRFNQRVNATGMVAATGAMLAVAGRQRAMTETALGDISTMGVKAMDLMEKRARAFSNRWANVTNNGFTSAAEKIKGGYANLTDEALAEVTRVFLITGRGLKGTSIEMAEMAGKAFNIHFRAYKSMTPKQFAEMFSGGLAAAYENFDTNASKMANAMATLGSEATNLKVPLEEQLSVIGMLTNIMKSPDQAGEAYKGFMANLVRAQDNLNKLRKSGTAKISFFKDDGGAKSTAEILDTLNNAIKNAGDPKRANQVRAAIIQAFGSETAAKLINNLLSMTDDLRKKTDLVKASMDKGLAPALEKANQRNQGFGEVAMRTYQILGNVADVIGKALKPALVTLHHWTEENLIPLQGWIEKSPSWVRWAFAIAGGISAIAVSVGVAASAFKLLNLTIWLSPITWVVGLAIAALISLVYVVHRFYKNWRQAWDMWGDYLIGIAAGVLFVFNPIAGILVALAGFIINHWSEIKAFFIDLWGSISAAFTKAWGIVSDLGEKVGAGLVKVWDVFGKGMSKVAEGLKKAWDKFWTWLKKKADIVLGPIMRAYDKVSGWFEDGEKQPGTRTGASGSWGRGPGANPVQAFSHRAQAGAIQARQMAKVKVELEMKAPRGTKIRNITQSGDSDLNLGFNLAGVAP